MIVIKVLFWLAVFTVAYAYVLFPLLVALRGWLFPRPIRTARAADAARTDEGAPTMPKVSMVIAVHNEEGDIRQKVENIRAMQYPAGRFEAVIASDGSTDGTNAILQETAAQAGAAVTLLLLERVGKATALNKAVEAARGEILVFSDANSIYAPDAITRLIEPFGDPSVGGVAGNQVYEKSKQGGNLSQSGEASYWDFDRWMKAMESRGGNVISATGAIYAIRRELFQPIIAGVTDDFYTSTAVIEQGYRLVFQPEARSFESVTAGAGQELKRKVRIITRGLRGVMARRALLNPIRYGFYALQLFSHKVLRRLVFVPLLVVLLSSLLLVGEGWLYLLAAAGQVAFYAMAGLGYLLRGQRKKWARLFKLPFFFVLANYAAFLATVNVLRGNQISLWESHRAQAARAGQKGA